jgi:sugar phosphate isomerase/epimerase
MKNSRRSFIKNSSMALIATGILPKVLEAAVYVGPKPKTLIGIQLYSVRDDMFKNPLATLKALSKMGYQYVEHANYVNRKLYGYTPVEFKKILTDLGMEMPSGHTVMNTSHWDASKKDFTDAWKYTVEDAAVLGQTYVISPWIDEKVRHSYDDLMMQLSLFNKSGELCKKHGMQFGYHNHDFEFVEKINGTLIYDLIIQNTNPDLVIQQLDFGNMFGHGGRAKEWIEKYPGRFPSLHVKDEMKSSGRGEMNDGYDSTTMGAGEVDPKGLCILAKKMSGAKHFIIEQESYQDKTPLECAKINLETIKTWGLV